MSSENKIGAASGGLLFMRSQSEDDSVFTNSTPSRSPSLSSIREAFTKKSDSSTASSSSPTIQPVRRKSGIYISRLCLLVLKLNNV